VALRTWCGRRDEDSPCPCRESSGGLPCRILFTELPNPALIVDENNNLFVN